MASKVFGIGLNKTGTTRLGVCLRTLGFRHSPFAGHFIEDAEAGRLKEIIRFAEGWDSFEDWPWPLIYRNLEQAFPNSRFILTTRRDADTWFDSLQSHAERTGPTEERRRVYGHAMPHGHRIEHCQIYNEHNHDVLSHFEGRPESFLHLCWDDGAGWPQLSAFLNVDIPREPFPHATGVSAAGNKNWQSGSA